ncbi:hypothetical protein PM082_007243 [Marasmius tenuissimus]|nr:hypothetical protein PM082_007243 [Marasmius tenuissimus]
MMKSFDFGTSNLTVAGHSFTAGCGQSQSLTLVAGTTITNTHSFIYPNFEFSLPQDRHVNMQEQPAPALSREFFQATDANHPLNLPNNITGDNGLVFTEDLLLLHRSVWSLPDGEILSHMKRMDSMFMDDNKWKVWVRRLMVCVSEPVNPPSEETWTCSNSNHTYIPIALNAANSVSSFLPDMHPNRPQLTGVHHTAISSGLSFNSENTPACDQYYHHAGHDVERSPTQEVPTPSTLVGSETSTPSTAYDSFSLPGSKETEFSVRRVPSPPAHASLGYHDTGAGAGILFKGDSSLPFVRRIPTMKRSRRLRRRIRWTSSYRGVFPSYSGSPASSFKHRFQLAHGRMP